LRKFARLYQRLDETTKTNEKINLLVEYFESASPEDSIWAIYFLIGRKPKQVIPARKLKEWTAELANIPDWLFDESYETVGDLAETITLLLPRVMSSTNKSFHYWVEDKLLPLKNKLEKIQKEEMIYAWNEMNNNERFVWNKLITGSFRVGVSAKIVVKALSIYSGVDEPVISLRLMGEWKPTKNFFNQIISHDSKDSDLSKPYPFYLAYQLDDEVENLGGVKDWQAEWKWDGIRSQLIKRDGKIFIWSRGEEMLNEKFPELESLEFLIPDGTVLDGEIIAWQDKKPMPFGELQKRISRKNVTKKIISEVPVIIIAYDLLEMNGEDIREESLKDRNKKLFELVDKISDTRLLISPKIETGSWNELKEKRRESRSRLVEGLMLKRIDSPYRVGRKRGDWWKWKIDPLTVDAVLIYAQRGHGRRANLYTDYTFGIWDGNQLVPFAKAYSGLTDNEIIKVDSFVRENAIEKFGPVVTVKPQLVFELAFEGIQKSTRHKSGIAVRFPRINRWRHDKTYKDADSLETIKTLIH
jgi:ATP-dependent DNA ligase